MREHGAQVQDYKGKRLVVADHFGDLDPSGNTNPAPRPADSTFALTFIEPGLVAFGGIALVRTRSICIPVAARVRRPTKNFSLTSGRLKAATHGSSAAWMC